jgi:hypothetical protein
MSCPPAQSSHLYLSISSNLGVEFHHFTETVIDPIKASVEEYVSKPERLHLLKTQIADYEKKVRNAKSKGKLPAMNPTPTPGVYDELYHKKLIENTSWMGKVKAKMPSLHVKGSSSSSSSGTKKRSENVPLLSTPEVVIDDIELHELFDQLTAQYMKDTKAKQVDSAIDVFAAFTYVGLGLLGLPKTAYRLFGFQFVKTLDFI